MKKRLTICYMAFLFQMMILHFICFLFVTSFSQDGMSFKQTLCVSSNALNNSLVITLLWIPVLVAYYFIFKKKWNAYVESVDIIVFTKRTKVFEIIAIAFNLMAMALFAIMKSRWNVDFVMSGYNIFIILAITTFCSLFLGLFFWTRK